MKQNKVKMIVLLLAAAMMASCSKSGGSEAPTTAHPTLKVSETQTTILGAYSASIRGQQDVEILPQVSGKIEQTLVKEGESVKKGQTLFIIDQVPYKAALRTAEAGRDVAQAALRTAELNLANSRVLHEKKVISATNLQTEENTCISAKATLEQAKAQLVNARNNLSYTRVTAPCDGVVGTLPYRTGTLVSPSMPQPLTTISDNRRMYVYFSMTENQILGLTRRYGSMDGVLKQMPEVQLRLSDGSIYAHTGKIMSISGVIDRSTGTVSARAEFANSEQILRSGASGTVLIPTTYSHCILVPQEATVKMQDKVMVYKVDKEGIAKSTIIEVAPSNDGKQYVVTAGLKPGDEIVASGAGLLRDGTKVK